jgi:hypothetical protein
MSTFNKTEHKVNTQMSVTIQYTNNVQTEKEIRKTIPFTVAPQK